MTTDLQKASLSKRIAAGILDAMLLCVLAVGAAALLTWLFGYEGHSTALEQAYNHYETQYGVEFNISQEQFDAMDASQQANFNAAYEALIHDDDAMYHYNMVVNLTLLVTTFSILLAIVVLEFVVPLLLKNGQTVGKKVFSLGLMRTDAVQVTPVQLFARAILGKFTIEIMISVYILILIFFNSIGITGPLVIGGILITQIICLAVTRTNSMIHDLLSGTVVVDISSQKIFRTSQDLLEYQKQIAAEQARRQNY
ncbi:MAG: RDD family protein [Oscillospiraceae bacterium]|nr:RDD family protein [Oscillospiraceae bacterium]